MKTIVFVISAMAKGGAERVISVLSEDYVKRGWNVEIVLLLHDIVQYELRPEIIVENISNDKMGFIKNVPNLVFKLRKIFRKTKPDIVVSFMDSAIITDVASIGLKIKKVTSERIDPTMARRNKWYQKILYKSYGNSDLLILQTKRAQNYFENIIFTHSVVIANPIVVKCFASDKHEHRIVSVGRLKKQKNQKMLIDVFSYIHKKYPEYSLYIYGEGELRKELEEQIKFLGLNDVVKLPGNSNCIHEEIQNAEMFVLTSDYEGLSNALLEAMMMGLPCISTNCSGSDEVICDGIDGLLVNVGNEKELTDAILRYIEKPYEREIIAKKGMLKANKEYNYERVISKWREEIDKLLD